MFLRTKTQTKPEPINEPVDFPAGTFVESTDGFFYYIGKNNLRLRAPSNEVISSWRVVTVPFCTEESLKRYVVSGSLPFRDGTLIRNQADKSADWYVSGGKLRRIENPSWYTWLDINDNDIIVVSKKVFDLHKIGEPLS